MSADAKIANDIEMGDERSAAEMLSANVDDTELVVEAEVNSRFSSVWEYDFAVNGGEIEGLGHVGPDKKHADRVRAEAQSVLEGIGVEGSIDDVLERMHSDSSFLKDVEDKARKAVERERERATSETPVAEAKGDASKEAQAKAGSESQKTHAEQVSKPKQDTAQRTQRKQKAAFGKASKQMSADANEVDAPEKVGGKPSKGQAKQGVKSDASTKNRKSRRQHKFGEAEKQAMAGKHVRTKERDGQIPGQMRFDFDSVMARDKAHDDKVVSSLLTESSTKGKIPGKGDAVQPVKAADKTRGTEKSGRGKVVGVSTSKDASRDSAQIAAQRMHYTSEQREALFRANLRQAETMAATKSHVGAISVRKDMLLAMVVNGMYSNAQTVGIVRGAFRGLKQYVSARHQVHKDAVVGRRMEFVDRLLAKHDATLQAAEAAAEAHVANGTAFVATATADKGRLKSMVSEKLGGMDASAKLSAVGDRFKSVVANVKDGVQGMLRGRDAQADVDGGKRTFLYTQDYVDGMKAAFETVLSSLRPTDASAQQGKAVMSYDDLMGTEVTVGNAEETVRARAAGIELGV